MRLAEGRRQGLATVLIDAVAGDRKKKKKKKRKMERREQIELRPA
jgi:hypothetical protein